MKKEFEKRVNKLIQLRIIYQGQDIIPLYEQDPKEYNHFCKRCFSSLTPFTDDFHIQEVKRHFEVITRNGTRSLVFPFETQQIHRLGLINYSNIVLLDMPVIDKAKHNFILRKHGFNDLPHLLVSNFLYAYKWFVFDYIDTTICYFYKSGFS